MSETGEQPLDEGLKDYLRERRLLLMLDNFEQVLGAAPAVRELLAVAPGLKVLATSRAAIGLYGEQEFPVPPLTLPDLKSSPSLETLTQYEAVGLFVERARAVKPDFQVTDESAPAVAETCVRLEGLPLAIELAAARIKMLPPQAMLQRLSSRLKLLTGGARDLPERQRTLRGAIQWSHALLDRGEQVLFARLAVFSGGRTLEAVDAICDAEGDLPVDTFEGDGTGRAGVGGTGEGELQPGNAVVRRKPDSEPASERHLLVRNLPFEPLAGYTPFMAASPDGTRSVVVSVNEQLTPREGTPGVFTALRATERRAVCAALSSD